MAIRDNHIQKDCLKQECTENKRSSIVGGLVGENISNMFFSIETNRAIAAEYSNFNWAS